MGQGGWEVEQVAVRCGESAGGGACACHGCPNQDVCEVSASLSISLSSLSLFPLPPRAAASATASALHSDCAHPRACVARMRTRTGDRGGRKWPGMVAGPKTQGSGWALEASRDQEAVEGPCDVMRAGLAILQDWMGLAGVSFHSFPAHSMCRLIDICRIRCPAPAPPLSDGPDTSKERPGEEDRVLRVGRALVEKMLEEREHGSAIRAIWLLGEHFSKDLYPCAQLVDLFVQRQDWDAAEIACAEVGGAGDKEALVMRLLSNGKFKQGLRLSREWDIEWLLLEARQGHARTSIDKLVAKAQVQLALLFAAYVCVYVYSHMNVFTYVCMHCQLSV